MRMNSIFILTFISTLSLAIISGNAQQIENKPKGDPCAIVRCGYGASCQVSQVDGRAICECQTICPLVYQPVRGSDGKIYSNQCQLQAEACRKKKHIRSISMPVKNYRNLHFVLKVGNLKKNIELFRDKLGMKVLRHEVFDEGCEAACNGPYDNKWSKTMIGYGPEDNHFVLELTYNYSVGQYKLGNDLQYIKISLKQDSFNKLIERDDLKKFLEKDALSLTSPDGYKFNIVKNDTIPKDDITEVCLASSDVEGSSEYWVNLLKMEALSETDNELELTYGPNQAVLRLRQIGVPIEHQTAYGRIAFSCPSNNLKAIQTLVEANKYKILKPYVSLDTPGKATVQVVILSDPDGHEICFVGDEGFRELSKVDPNANDLIEKSMAEDKSDEWFEKKGKSKTNA